MKSSLYFGRRLKRARLEKKITQADLASMLGVSKQAVSYWENGQNFPNKNKLTQLCDILECSIEWLLAEDDILKEDELELLPPKKSIPIIDLKTAMNYMPEDYVTNPHRKIRPYNPQSKHAFAISIIDTSMEPEFVKNDVVVIDPMLSPRAGDRVLAATEGLETALFRVLEDGINFRKKLIKDNFILTPINPDWLVKEIDGNGRIIGVMSEHLRLRRFYYPPIKRHTYPKK